MSTKEKKVLIVDDEKDIVETLKFIFESEGINCIVAYDGEEALDKAKNENPYLIILDVMLPKINGYKICRLLKFDKKYQNIYIIMVTARSQQEDKVIGKETGADEYISKPFVIDKLVNTVKAYLQKEQKVL